MGHEGECHVVGDRSAAVRFAEVEEALADAPLERDRRMAQRTLRHGNGRAVDDVVDDLVPDEHTQRVGAGIVADPQGDDGLVLCQSLFLAQGDEPRRVDRGNAALGGAPDWISSQAMAVRAKSVFCQPSRCQASGAAKPPAMPRLRRCSDSSGHQAQPADDEPDRNACEDAGTARYHDGISGGRGAGA